MAFPICNFYFWSTDHINICVSLLNPAVSFCHALLVCVLSTSNNSSVIITLHDRFLVLLLVKPQEIPVKQYWVIFVNLAIQDLITLGLWANSASK